MVACPESDFFRRPRFQPSSPHASCAFARPMLAGQALNFRLSLLSTSLIY